MIKPDVVKYESTYSRYCSVCSDCEARYKAAGVWPKDNSGEEYAKVSHGRHEARCQACEARETIRELSESEVREISSNGWDDDRPAEVPRSLYKIEANLATGRPFLEVV